MKAWPAPAKLNLFLHVTGRRADGYHELQTVFQFLDYGDALSIEPTRDGRVARTADLPGVPEGEDLTIRAARALKNSAPPESGCRITLTKRLPLGSGLGGGSSDAATTLVALDRLWGLSLPVDELARIGLELGADVPVFVRGEAAWAQGVGEQLTPVAPRERWFLVVTPPCTVSTREMFAAPELCRATLPIRREDWLAGRARSHNDFEPVVRARYPAVAEALDWLADHAGSARLSGSGAAAFADFALRDDAAEAQARLPAGWTSFVARGCNRSPLHGALQVAPESAEAR